MKNILLLLSFCFFTDILNAKDINYFSDINDINSCNEGTFIIEKLKVPRNKSNFLDKDLLILDDIAKKIKKWEAKILIIGHADITNTPTKSMKNSKHRANNVRNILIKNEVNEKLIDTIASGESDVPFEKNEDNKKNQTVSFKILYCPTIRSEKKKIILATATTGGTYYPIGNLLSKMWNDTLKNEGIEVEVITTQGSVHNVELLKNNEADIAMLTSLVAYNAFTDKNSTDVPFYQGFSALTSLWPNVQHFILHKKLIKTGNIQDIKNIEKGFCIGKKKSATALSAKLILKKLDINIDNKKIPYCGGYKEVVDELILGKKDGATIAGGTPVSSVSDLYLKNNNFSILQFSTEDIVKNSISELRLLPHNIPPHTYHNQEKNIMTISEPNLLVINNNIDNRIARLLINNLFDNIQYLRWSHDALKDISKDSSGEGIPEEVPLHSELEKIISDR